ncbi:hypothetical protein ACH0B5_10725 [Ureibacillus sp. 179-F W5.1 NHS]|uniref:Uncharacterized protein n=1 Tax=Lysinibacillus halotolerans TaxID=1368476 RepID=A0A3M8HG56_9BACI|nr:hypothetical protein [Lysinibacillus halotolerans]RND01377.1 hypothetical protein EC501_01855 [Lysinibacillus halotolerans]
MTNKKEFDDYSNYDDRGLLNESSATAKSSQPSANSANKQREEFGAEKNPLLKKIKNNPIMKKVEQLFDNNKQ